MNSHNYILHFLIFHYTIIDIPVQFCILYFSIKYLDGEKRNGVSELVWGKQGQPGTGMGGLLCFLIIMKRGGCCIPNAPVAVW